MMLPRLSQRQKALAAAALALLLWLPSGISTETQPVVTGHSTFYNGSGYDPCLASIAGIVRNRVMWFNDQVLVESYGGKGSFVYITEHGARDPTDPNIKLLTDGTFYDFVDPNGVHWHVEEDYYTVIHGGATVDPNTAPAQWVQQPSVDQNKTYVWIVELAASPIHDQFAGAPDGPYYHDIYNFLVLVDTCKMHPDKALDTRTNDPTPDDRSPLLDDNGTLSHDARCNCTNSGQYGHVAGSADHTHRVFLADLYMGTQPTAIPAGASAQGAQYTSSWAVGNDGSNLTRTENNVEQAPNSGGGAAPSTGG